VGADGAGGSGGQQGKAKPQQQGAAPPSAPKSKGKGKSEDGPTLLSSGECFKCGRGGHFQADCTYDPLCVLCSQEGHISANCPSRGRPMLVQTYGNAIAGGGFFNIEVEPLQPRETGDVFAAVIQFKAKVLSDAQLSNELKHLMDDSWDWQVAKVSESEFSVRFPSRETLRMSTRSGRIFLPLSQSEANIREAFVEVRPGRSFPSVWVQVSGLPNDLMTKDRIMAALTMVGRPMEVDELSVRKHETEPVRVRFQCRFPERINGSVQLCVNGEPFTIGLHAELGGRGSGGSGAPPPPPPAPWDDDRLAEDSEDPSSELEPRHNCKNSQSKDKQASGGAGKGSGGASGGVSQVLGKGIFQYGSNIPTFLSSPLSAAGGGLSLVLGSAGSVPAPAGSGLSTETISQVEDPADPTSAWLLDLPLRESVPSSILSPMRGVVHEDGVPSAGSGPSLGLLQPNAAMAAMRRSLEAEAVQEMALDLRKESTAAVSLVRGKRTKVVTTGTVRTPGTRARKSSRLTGALLRPRPWRRPSGGLRNGTLTRMQVRLTPSLFLIYCRTLVYLLLSPIAASCLFPVRDRLGRRFPCYALRRRFRPPWLRWPCARFRSRRR
jgi:hypothetical protein